MKYLTAKDIRHSFLDFFESKGHKKVPSSSLVPYNDHTLLFTNAGMVQFKEIFLGLEKRDYSRAVTAQRCVRAGGKHNDLETVGRTARHHTFFEMLGNFSFGDYFKNDAIAFAWEYLTEVLEMPKDKLYVTVYEEDDEARELWHQIAGIDYQRIFRIGAHDNFWSMGDTGPCGPCSEIFFDRGEKYGCDAQVCGIGECDCDRWMEIWNLVFMQYDRDIEGNLTPLPKPSIDTGMGLERVASIVQGVDSNYDTDIMKNIINGVEQLSGKKYSGGQSGFPFRVIADHARSCSFLIADGIIPSNEGRGYVLRRILRRAARLGMLIGLDQPFLYQLFPYVKSSMADAYPVLLAEEENIIQAIRMEEERFHLTLSSGIAMVQKILHRMRAEGATLFSGNDLFMLYDTYGFPLDLAKDIAEEEGMTIDEQGFEQAMEQQRSKSQSSRTEGGAADELQALGYLLADLAPTAFTGYEQLADQAVITALISDGNKQEQLQSGATGWLVLDRTPFYGEAGGQIGDTGYLTSGGAKIEVQDTQKLPNGVFVHKILIADGNIKVGDSMEAMIDSERRRAIARNHSATHLLHRALRLVLGEQLHQAGSYVSHQRLRFDFNYFEPLTAEQLREIEAEVNRQILANLPIDSQEMPIDEAKARGAIAFFGDKYGDIVRMVSMGEVSSELCGGTHCSRTGDLGLIKILSESGIGSGMRRIEAVTGTGALDYYLQQEEKLYKIADMLKSNLNNMEKRLESIIVENKATAKELEQLKTKLASSSSEELWQQAQEIGGISFLSAQVEADDMPALRNMLDMLRDKLQDSAIILAASQGDKVQFVASMSEKAIAEGLHAGKIIKEVAAVCGGGGGGRPDMAQAGASDNSPQKIQAALNKAEELIKKALN
jgi:alanyl-tRNA synthetase